MSPRSRAILIWIVVLSVLAFAAIMLWKNLEVPLAALVGAITALFGVDTAHQHLGNLIDAKYPEDETK